MLSDRGRLALGGEDFHDQPVQVLAVRVDEEYLVCVAESVRPAFFFNRELCKSVQDTRKLFAVKRALLLGPIVVKALHKITPVECVGGLETAAKLLFVA